MYYFDRDDFLDFDKGNSKCYCLPNGLGGYSCHSIINSSYRKHYGYLIAALKSPVDRKMILGRINESVIYGNKSIDFEAQKYDTGIKTGNEYLDDITINYLPEYHYSGGPVSYKKTIAPIYGSNSVAITYEIMSTADCQFYLEPLFNYRDHGDVSTKESLKFELQTKSDMVCLIPEANPECKIKFSYSAGYVVLNDNPYTDGMLFDYDIKTGDDRMDYFYKPFKLRIDLRGHDMKLVSIITTIDRLPKFDAFDAINQMTDRHAYLIRQAKCKDSLADDLVVASDNFICKRDSTNLKTVLAGLPWFTDWGRDTMIAFTGLTLCTRRFKDAKEILKSFSKYERNGLIPNMFPDDGAEPLYNTVDASLWYINACYKYVNYTNDYAFIKEEIYPVLKKIVEAYKNGTDFNIGMDKDYLIHAGSDLDQITWMDVRVGDLVVTPRHGKPVEINALWYNALMCMAIFAEEYGEDSSYYANLASNVKESFNKKFYCAKTKCLYDVIDENDESIRPNQLYALSLPFKVVDKELGKSILAVCERELYNNYGLRSLAKSDKRFKPNYIGKLMDRDLAYHMGTTWGYLIGPYLDAISYVKEDSEETIHEINELCHKFIETLNDGCINGVAEVFDGDIATEGRGCFTQAWSVAELLRAYYENVLLNKD